MLGHVTYSVETTDGQIWKRHTDQLKETLDSISNYSLPESTSEEYIPPTSGDTADPQSTKEDVTMEGNQLPEPPPKPSSSPSPVNSNLNHSSDLTTFTPLHRRYPTRIRHPPDRFQ